MAGSMADYLENALLNQLFTGASAPSTATVKVALLTSTPTTDAGTFTEVSGNNYARASVTSNGTNWTVTANSVSNAQTITFNTPSSTGWGTVNAFAIYDNASTNMLFWGTLTSAKTINGGDTVTFPASSLTITLD